MGHVYEIVINMAQYTEPMASVFHVWDGAEDNTSQQILDAFKTGYIIDAKAVQSNTLDYTRISVVPLDVGNGKAPAVENLSDVGAIGGDPCITGTHVWVKLVSDDNGFKSGGKLFPGLVEADITAGVVVGASLALIQTVFDDLITDMVAAGVALCIYRPTLSTPGFPSISITSTAIARGVGTNNRRQRPFQA